MHLIHIIDVELVFATGLAPLLPLLQELWSHIRPANTKTLAVGYFVLFKA